MNLNTHSKLKGAHAFLSPSNYHWLRYDEDKLIARWMNHKEAARGTVLHEYAAMAIELKRKQPRNEQTLNRYINDAIGFRMTPEQPLFYSLNCYGTADALAFRDTTMRLRIHDLKNGVTPGNMDQLRVYNALFCLEYEYMPHELDTELRIYQNDEVVVEVPDPDHISEIISRIRVFDRIIEGLKEELEA